LAIAPSVNAYVFAAFSSGRLRDANDEMQDAKKALALDGNNAPAWSALGEAEYLSGNYQNAIDDETSALRLEPDLPFALWIRDAAQQSASGKNASTPSSDSDLAPSIFPGLIMSGWRDPLQLRKPPIVTNPPSA
jgi:tetratricopeptide (TPR) repeat protein